jgi:predicted small secreted protein
MSKACAGVFLAIPNVQIARRGEPKPSALHDASGPVASDALGQKRASGQTAIAWDRVNQNGLPPAKASIRKNTNMITLIKRIVVLLFVSAFLVTIGVGCNTAHGFGKDMENAGEGIQNGTK